MSLLNTESWMMFGRMPVADNDASADAERTKSNTTLTAAGYQLLNHYPTQQTWVVRADPVYPERNAIQFSAPLARTAVSIIRKPVSVSGETIIGGFSLFVPSTFTASLAYYPHILIFAMFAATSASGMPAINDQAVPYAGEVFRVRWDLQIAYGGEVQSSKRVVPGKQCYIEYRITPTEIRIWMDDTLVLQKNASFSVETIGFGMMSWGGDSASSNVSGPGGQWSISNWYNLAENADTPNVRLGATTRVIGVKPASDSSAQFARPSAYASNAQVAALPFNPDAQDFLKTDTVGVKDIYNGVDDIATASAGLVHAVSVKVLAKNIDTVPHAIKPIVVSGGVESGVAVPMADTLKTISSISTIDPSTGIAWTPAAAATAKFGMKIES